MKMRKKSTASKVNPIQTLHPRDPKIQDMLQSDTFRNYKGHVGDPFVDYVLFENTYWLPRIPQASAFIQRWVLTDNPMLLFTDIEWKFDIETAFPGVTAWIRDCLPQAIEYRLSTPQLGKDGIAMTWCSQKEHLNDDCWLEWQMLRELAAPDMAPRLTEGCRLTLQVMDWKLAKELIRVILSDGGAEQIALPADFSFNEPEVQA
jgi:hypothetical protein